MSLELARNRNFVISRDTKLEMDDLTPQRLEVVISEVTRDISINTDLGMQEFLGIDRALTRIKGELENNASKVSEVEEHIKKSMKSLLR